MGRQRRRRIVVLAGALLFAGARARAGEPLIQVSCTELSTEQAAEVEARVRASLLMSELAAPQVRILCGANQASVEVICSWGKIGREVPTSAARLQDDLVAAVDAELAELAKRRAQSENAIPLPPATSSSSAPRGSIPDLASGLAPPLPALPPEEPASPIAASRPEPALPLNGSELLLEATAEPWPGAVGLGGNVGFSHRAQTLRYGLTVGGAESAANAAFGVSEWHARVELGWQPAWAAGFRGALGFGPSLLIVTPKGDTTARAGTASSAWFAELALGRPFWFGRVAVAPSASLRLFSAARRVNVDANARFTLSGLSPALGLGVIYVVN